MNDQAAMMNVEDDLKGSPGPATATNVVAVDQSKASFESHTDCVYAVASYYDAATHTLPVASVGRRQSDLPPHRQFDIDRRQCGEWYDDELRRDRDGILVPPTF